MAVSQRLPVNSYFAKLHPGSKPPPVFFNSPLSANSPLNFEKSLHPPLDHLPQHRSRKGFSGGSQKIIGVYIWRLERRVAMRRELVWWRQPSAGSSGSAPLGVQGAKPPEFFLTLLPIFEHGLQFRFNEITYFLEH